jgi:hypothetical protein
MDADTFPELAAVRTLLESAGLPGEAREAALWCLGQMTRPYREFLRTQEHRFHDAVQGLAQAMLKHLRDYGGPGVADAFVAQLHALHERLGLPPLSLKPAPPTGRRQRKAA